MSSRSGVLVGCCGWGQSQRAYFEQFDCIEIQQTFYQPPRPTTVQRWRAAAPREFVFCLKAWQLITHEPSSPTYRRLTERLSADQRQLCGRFCWSEPVRRAWQVTREVAEQMEARVVIFQSPASFGPEPGNVDNLRRFFGSIERGQLLLGWESRGRWPPDCVGALCRELDLIDVVDPFVRQTTTPGRLRYYRLHGIGGYRYRFGDEDLRRLQEMLRAAEGFVLFNNVSMVADAARFRELLAAGPGRE